MTKKTKTRQAPAGGRTRVQARQARKTARGQEIWVISGDGGQKQIITTGTSAAVMDDAVLVYQDALKRLADR
jgi:hypothetical protein